ncbi:MAG: carboxypeptidase regulatory-like domain-containing protein [Acidobacteria bacterium]|nr:carboxypeptidase regulatory-like domain-containing protein [Acidobacteriota bacterium]
MNRGLRALLGVLLLLTATTSAWAQATAQINGTVADSSGGVLPGVTVIAIQTETGFRREAVSDENGAYSLLNLPIGPYRIEASLSGFRTFAQTGVVLQVASNPVIPVRMELGSLEETVSVEASAPLVETRNPAVGAVITNEQVEELPLEGRNPATLVLLAGGAVDTGNPSSRSLTGSRGIATAGGQQFGVAYLLDGAMHNNVYDGVNLQLPFPDAMQEFRVETSSQNAQNGYKAGGTASVATKAGTNAFHGDVFEFARHHKFNATSPFAAINRATGERYTDGLVRNQFGGVIGGPIKQDRIFFFAAYQGTRATETPADIVTFIPTAAMLAGDFTTVASAQCRAQGNLVLPAALGFVNNRINPALLSPAAVAIAKRLPTTTDPCGQISYSRSTKPEEKQPIGRVDVQLNQNHSLFGRYMLSTTYWDPAFSNTPDNILSNGGLAGSGGRDNYSHSLVVGDTLVLSNTVVNNLRVSMNKTKVQRWHADMFGPQDVGIKIFSYLDKYVTITNTGAFGLNTATESFASYAPTTYSIADDLTLVRGDHQYAIGGAVSLSNWQTITNVRSMGAISFNGTFTGLTLGDFLLGRMFEYRQATPFQQDITQNYMALFGQDTWRVSPKVTVNYGVRWEPWFPQNSNDKAFYAFDAGRLKAGERSKVFPAAPAGLHYPGDEGFPGTTGMKTVWSNVAPRVGISWDPTGEGRTSVRAGYGMTGDFVTGQFFFDSRSAPPFGLEQRLTGALLDDPWGSVGRTNPFPVTTIGTADYPFQNALASLFITVPYDIKTTRNHSWNVALQQQLGDSTAVSVTYLANHMVNMWGVVDGNPALVTTAGATPAALCTAGLPGGPVQTFANCTTSLDARREISLYNPGVGQYYGYVDYVTDAGWQDYQGLQLSLTRRSDRFTTGANYTVSRCEGLISQGQSPLNVATGYSRPVSVLNPPSEAETEALYEIDKGRCDSWRAHVFSLSATVRTPEFSNTAARMILSDWSLAGIFRAQSGQPLTVTTGSDRALSGMQASNQRATQVGDNPYGNGSLTNWFSPAAFAQPALGTYGTSVRNAYDGPGYRNIDLALVRQFQLPRGHRLEARVEAFNALNWFMYGNPNTVLSNSTFGQITSNAGAPRVMQFAGKYVF